MTSAQEGSLNMDETTLAIGRLQAAQKALVDRQDRNEAATNAKFQTIDTKLNTADAGAGASGAMQIAVRSVFVPNIS